MVNKLGTISLSPDILEKGNIGLWAFELDEGKEPRMYVDSPMLKLIGLEHQVSPEETYHAWYDHIDEASYGLVADAVEKMTNGEHAEVQYPWHHPNGNTMIVRCGGVRNYEYKDGIRIEGTHQDVTQVFHFDEEQKRIEKDSLLNYFVDSYDSAYFVNLAKGTFEILHMNTEFSNVFGQNGNKKEGMIKFINEHIHPDDREMMLEIIDTDYVKRKLKDNNLFSFTVREQFGDIEKTMRGQIIHGADEDHVAVGFMDITKETLEQQKRLLGTIPLSPDVLSKANIGLWAFELDEGEAPRMYADEAMIPLIGLEHQMLPEETYHAWYDHIDEGSYDLVADAVEKMTNGEHAEVQYPWHHPDGHTMVVRCGGVRNFEYKKGIRIEGTHQDVTQTLHFDEKERERYLEQERTLVKLQFRVDALRFVVENDPNLDSFMDFFGSRIMETTGCDQVIFRSVDDYRVVRSADGIDDVPQEFCLNCPFTKFDSKAFEKDDIVIMNDCKDGFNGVSTNVNCPVKSSIMQYVVIAGKLEGMLSIHYLREYHSFSEEEIDIIKTVSTYLGLFLGRIESQKVELERIKAESSNLAKTQFLFNMSHDIRTPMNAIIGFTDIAINHIDEPERVNDSLNKIKSSSEHLLNLINDILEMSRIEAGKMEITNAPLDIREAIKKVNLMSQSLAVSKDVNYKSTIGNIKNPYILADELHVNQVLINLISNAVKYTNVGGDVEYIAEQISEPVNNVVRYRFTIKDTGIGMSEEFQSHLFESFSREKTVDVSKQEGAGLGLAIVKRIIDLAGGSIDVESKKDVGSTFTVEFPFELMSDEEIERFKDERNNKNALNTNSSLEGKRVLLAEDNEMNREIATELLEEAGMIVETAEDGEIAVKNVEEKGVSYYDFILMDIQMPIKNGYEATADIRKLPNGNLVPIIALSANAFKEDKKRSLEAGMNEHVAKPINVKELFDVISKLL